MNIILGKLPEAKVLFKYDISCLASYNVNNNHKKITVVLNIFKVAYNTIFSQNTQHFNKVKGSFKTNLLFQLKNKLKFSIRNVP